MTARHYIPLEQMTVASFEPYGELIKPHGAGTVVNDGFGRRYETATRPGPTFEGAVPSLAFYVLWPRPTPIEIDQLECHRHSTQTFLPKDGQAYLVVVAPQDRAGGPDMSGVRAFAADGSAGITYHAGVWHAGLTCLNGIGTFAMLMWVGAEEDTRFVELSSRIAIDASVTGDGQV